MMQFFPKLLIPLALLLTCSCKSYPISTKVRLEPKVPRAAKLTHVVITAKNNTGRDMYVSPYVKMGGDWVMDGAGTRFSRESRAGLIVGDAVSLCPPQFDVLPAKSSREYTFYWTPKASDAGDGFLHVGVPFEFRPLKPIPVRVEN